MKHDSKCLVILTPGFPANEDDNACLPWMQAFVKKINEIFPNLNILVLSLEYPFTKSKYDWFKNTVFSFDGWKKSKFYKLRMWVSIWRTLSSLREQYIIAGMISFWCGEAAFIGSTYARRKGIQHIIRVCGQDAENKNKWVQRIKPKPGELVPISDFLALEFFKNHNIKAAHVVPMAIDPKSFPDELPSEKDIDILGVGALIPLKRYDLFVEIIHALRKHLPNIKSAQCGVGPEEERIRTLIRDWQLHENIMLTGKISHIEMLKLMQRSKVLLHPSEYEGFGVVCLEALYAGAHVISFGKPMNEKIDNWHIVENKEEMVKKVLELLKDANTQFESKLPYSMEDNVKAIMDVLGYKEINDV